jgi:predicted negative regulator of RcsB-dependent stress response
VNTQATSAPKDPFERVLDWVEHHRRLVMAAAAVIVVVAGAIWFVLAYQRRKAAAADAALEQARIATQSGNLPLAASDLSRLIASYGGTQAADEAVIILGQVRLDQNQAPQAVQELRTALDRGLSDQFRAPAYALLGAALEGVGNMREAARAYEQAADAAWYPALSAEYLTDAGRTYASAGDLTNAIAAYQRVVDKHPDAPSALEARVRLAELTAQPSAASTQPKQPS